MQSPVNDCTGYKKHETNEGISLICRARLCPPGMFFGLHVQLCRFDSIHLVCLVIYSTQTSSSVCFLWFFSSTSMRYTK